MVEIDTGRRIQPPQRRQRVCVGQPGRDAQHQGDDAQAGQLRAAQRDEAGREGAVEQRRGGIQQHQFAAAHRRPGGVEIDQRRVPLHQLVDGLLAAVHESLRELRRQRQFTASPQALA